MPQWILVGNDDGIEAPGLAALVSTLQRKGMGVIVAAPSTERSATSMHLTLRRPMLRINRTDLLAEWDLDPNGIEPIIHSFDGMPADCMILEIDGPIRNGTHPTPRLCISGINRGPNMSVDVLHSGTVAAAREASLYGIPSIAVSLTTFEEGPWQAASDAVSFLVDRLFKWLPDTPIDIGRESRSAGSIRARFGPEDGEIPIREAFSRGDILLNLNVPPTWKGDWSSTSLGARWYHGAANIEEDGFCQVGAVSIEDEPIPGTDVEAVMSNRASLTPVSTWPQSHPLDIGSQLLSSARNHGEDEMPFWV